MFSRGLVTGLRAASRMQARRYASPSTPPSTSSSSTGLYITAGAAGAVAAYLAFSDGIFSSKTKKAPKKTAEAAKASPPAAPAPAAEPVVSVQSGVANVPEPVMVAPAEDLTKITELTPEAVETLIKENLSAPYVIVGAGTAAFFAMRGITDTDKSAKVLIIGAESDQPYMRPPLSKELWFKEDGDDDNLKFKDWSGRERDLYFRKPEFYCKPEELKDKEGSAVALVTGHKVVDMDVFRKVLLLDDGREVSYDKCLLATGGRPKTLPAFQDPALAPRVLLYRTTSDFRRLRDAVMDAKSIAIVGGGFLGSELAVALANKTKATGATVTQIFPEDGNMARVLPKYLSKWTTEQVKKQGVTVRPHSYVQSAALDASGKEVVMSLSNGEQVKADYVLVAVGLEPNTELASKARLELDSNKGGILVNAELEARTDVWAAGDVSSFYDTSLGRRREEHHDHAAVSGRLAGENMAGARKPYYHQSMFWSDLGPSIGYEAIGIIDSALPTVGVWAKATKDDTPKAATEEGSIRSGVSESAPQADAAAGPAEAPSARSAALEAAAEEPAPAPAAQEDEFGKGVVFYMRDDRVVGVVLWNVFNKIPIARKIIRDAKVYTDTNELASLFKLHEAAEEHN